MFSKIVSLKPAGTMMMGTVLLFPPEGEALEVVLRLRLL